MSHALRVVGDGLRVTSYESQVTRCKWKGWSMASCNDTHEPDEKNIEYFLDAYDELGSKINRFIKYVEDEWK